MQEEEEESLLMERQKNPTEIFLLPCNSNQGLALHCLMVNEIEAAIHDALNYITSFHPISVQ